MHALTQREACNLSERCMVRFVQAQTCPCTCQSFCSSPIQKRKEAKLCGLPWIWEFMFQCVQTGVYKITKSRHNEGQGYKCFAFKARVLRLIFRRSIMKVLSIEVQFSWELKEFLSDKWVPNVLLAALQLQEEWRAA